MTVALRCKVAECQDDAALSGSAARMPEDWAQELALVQSCAAEVKTHCAGVKLGRAQLYRCLE